MILRHATQRRNLTSIRKHGLLPARSKGLLPAVWLHSPAHTLWAVLHTVKRHRCKASDVVILEVRVPRRQLRRSRKGLWYSLTDIRPSQLRRRLGFAELAGSPVAV